MTHTPEMKSFAERLRSRETIVGYWTQLSVPEVQERVARLGYDYVCFDAQHGFLDSRSIRNGLLAVDAGAALGRNHCAGIVRVAANSSNLIGEALDAGARSVIVPLVNRREDAAAAVRACQYPPKGDRSYGPMRAGLRSGPNIDEMNSAVGCVVMIETSEGLDRVEEIAQTPGVDGIYIGPADLMLAIGGRTVGDPDLADAFEAAVACVLKACAEASIAAGFHTATGELAAKRLEEGFTFASISSDLNHVDKVAGDHLAAVIGARERAREAQYS